MQGPGPDSRIGYIDGAFDLFHAGHVEVNANPSKHERIQRKTMPSFSAFGWLHMYVWVVCFLILTARFKLN